jgi:uncharacterized cupin superfamily protein
MSGGPREVGARKTASSAAKIAAFPAGTGISHTFLNNGKLMA